MVNQKFDLVNHSTTNTIKLVSRRIKKFVELNDKIPNSNSTLTYFHSKHVALISIESYLNRILKYTLCGNECFLSVLVYFHRMSQIQNYIPSFPSSCKKNKKPFIINSYNIHRLLIAGITVSAKFNSDIFFLNSHYAKVGGLPINELNNLEMEFLMLNNYDLHVSVEELQYTGNCLLNNTLPEPVIVNGVKRMELLSQPVFFNKTINKFALTFEDTILIEKRIKDEERKYGRAARLIKRSLYERSKSSGGGSGGDSELEREKSNSYRSLKYSKSYDIMKSSSKKDQYDETYRYSYGSSGNPNALPYQPPNALPYVTSKNSTKRSDFGRHASRHSSKKSSHTTNSKLSYRHSTNSMNLSQYQDKVDLQNQLKNSSHHESMLFMSNNLPYTTDTSKKSSSTTTSTTDKYDMVKMARQGGQDIDENVLKANFKSFMDPENKLGGKETEKFQKAFQAYKEMYIKEMMLKNKTNSSQAQVVPVEEIKSDTISANISSHDGATTTASASSKKYINVKKSMKEQGRRKIKEKIYPTNSVKGNDSFNTSSSSSFLDSENDQSYYRTHLDPNTSTLSPSQRLHHQGLNPPQPSNHRVSHLDLNQARKSYSRPTSNPNAPPPPENRHSIRNSYTDDSFELSSPKPNNSYKNARRVNGTNHSKNIKNGEYSLKTYYNEEYQPPESSFLTTENDSFQHSFSNDPSHIISESGSLHHEIVNQLRPAKDRKNGKEKVHKRLSRNLNRILNNFGDHSKGSDTDKEKGEKEKGTEKGKEDEKKDKENVTRVRKGVKLMERKIKGLSLSHLLKQNKEHDHESNLKERHSFSVLSLSHAERQKLNFLTNPELGFTGSAADRNNGNAGAGTGGVEELKGKQFSSSSLSPSSLKPLDHHRSKDQLWEKEKRKEKREKKGEKQQKKSSSSSLKKLKDEEKSLESSRRYYETLTNILKRNKENSKKDYSTYLNDIDIKVTSNSNDTINQITEIYHTYTENPTTTNEKSNEKSNSVSHSGTKGKSNRKSNEKKSNPASHSDSQPTTNGKLNEKSDTYPRNKININGTLSDDSKKNKSKSCFIEENDQFKTIIKHNKMTETPKHCEISIDDDPSSTNLGEFDDVKEPTRSFYHDLNEEKKNFNQNIYDFNKYYHSRYDTDESNGREEGGGGEGEEDIIEIDNSTDVNSFDLRVIDEKNKVENNDGSYDFIKKTHSYTATDIYSYYANLNNSKNNDDTSKPKSINQVAEEEEEIELKELKRWEPNKGKEEKDTSSIDTPEDQNIRILKSYYQSRNKLESSLSSSSSPIMPTKSKVVKQQQQQQQQKINPSNSNKFAGGNTEEYENEIHNIKNFLEQQNETINADFSKLSNEEGGEVTNFSSFATSVPSTYISSSMRDNEKSDSSSPLPERSELEEEKVTFTNKEKELNLAQKEGKSFSDYYNTRRLNSYSSTTDEEERKIEKEKLKEKEKERILQSHIDEITEVPTDARNDTHLDGPSSEDKYYLPPEDESKNDSTQPAEHDHTAVSTTFPIKKNMIIHSNYTSKTAISMASTSSSSPLLLDNPQQASPLEDTREKTITSSESEKKNKTWKEGKASSTDSKTTNAPLPHHTVIMNTNDEHVTLRNFRSSSDPTLSYNSSSQRHSLGLDPTTRDIHTSDSLPASPLPPSSSHHPDFDDDHDHDQRQDQDQDQDPNHVPPHHHYIHDDDDDDDDSNTHFVKKSTINYHTVDFNNPLSYVSYPNYPIYCRNGDIGNSQHRESFQNLLKQFQKNCKTNDNNTTAIADLHKKYGTRHSQSTLNSDTSTTTTTTKSGNGNISFNEILEKFKKNCDVAERNHHQSHGKPVNVSSHSSSTTLTTMNTIPYSSSTTTDTTTIPANENITTTTTTN